MRTGESTVRRREVDDLEKILRRDFSECDIVLVEGYKRPPMTRIHVGKARRFGVDFEGQDYTEDLDGLVASLSRRLGIE